MALDSYATRADIQNNATATNGALAYLLESDREGLFVFKSGNFTTRVAADTQQGIYLEADGVSASVGAWVRQLPEYGTWQVAWFGVPSDPASGNGGGTEVQCHTEMTAMLNLGAIDNPQAIVFGSQIYTLGAALPTFTWQVSLIGSRGQQGTIIVKRYVEASNVRGVLSFSDHGFTLVDLTLRATSGSGGSGISAILTQNSPAAGRTYLVRTYVSMGDFCDYSLYVNGQSNTTAGGPSYRGLFIQGGEYFGAAEASIALVGVHHWQATGVFVATSGGSGPIALQGSGTAAASNDDWQFQGILAGNVNLNYLSRSVLVSPQTGNIYVDATSTDIQWIGPRLAGTVTNNAAAGEFQHSYDAMIVAQGGNSTTGWRKWGSGRLEQWGKGVTGAGGRVTGTWPVAFTSTAIKAHANVDDNIGATAIGIAQVIPTSITAYELVCAVSNYSGGTGTLSAGAANVSYSAIGA